MGENLGEMEVSRATACSLEFLGKFAAQIATKIAAPVAAQKKKYPESKKNRAFAKED